MTHSPARLALTSLLLCVVVSGGRGGASAEDEAPANSAAEQAFRDAWWAETGGGNLAEALALYEKAATAAGPTSVQAKALYRRAVVLQRIGKTEEAIQALERLAKTHPGETALQADARARLEEWTAIDLRTGFPEWYRRFQYGPEFQAKVLDLVLKLGSADVPTWSAAERELLAIGEPAIGALRAHVGARDSTMRHNIVKVLLLLGVVPDEVTTTFGYWTQLYDTWGAILDLPDDRRRALLDRLPTVPGDESLEALRAALQGPERVLAWFATLPAVPTGTMYPRYGLQGALMARLGSIPGLAARVDAVVREGLPDPWLWRLFAERMIAEGRATLEDVRAWAANPQRAELDFLIDALRKMPAVPADEALATLRRRAEIGAANNTPWTDLRDAVLRLLPALPWPESKDEVANVLMRAWPHVHNRAWPPAGPRLAEVLARMAESAPSTMDVGAVVTRYTSTFLGSEPELVQVLVQWIRHASSERLRMAALESLSRRQETVDLALIVDLLTESGVPAGERQNRWRLLLISRHGAPVWTDASALARLFATIREADAALLKTGGGLAQILAENSKGPNRASALVREWLREPKRTPSILLALAPPLLWPHLSESGSVPALRTEFFERWRAGDVEDRASLLQGLNVLGMEREPNVTDDELQAFWREQLRARPHAVPPDWRPYVMHQLKTLTLDDLRSVYDLSDPAQADEVSQLVGGSGGPRVPPSRDVFEALRLALRPDGPHARELAAALHPVPGLDEELVPLLLASNDKATRHLALDMLRERSSPEDQEHWLRALGDAAPSVRITAAKWIERVPTPATQKALVAALDDPHPDVRAAALESLDAIQKMEDLKARWREKVR